MIAGAIARDGTVCGLSRKDAPMSKVLNLQAPCAGDFAAGQTIIASLQDAAIIDGKFSSPLNVSATTSS